MSAEIEPIGAFAEPVQPCTPSATGREVYDRFSADHDLLAIPVVEADRPIGLIHREDFILRLADMYGRALYEGKPITHLMDSAPYVVDGGHSVDFVSRYIALERPSALLKGFVVTQGGLYVGVVTGVTLLQATVERQKRHAAELQAAQAAAEEANKAKSSFLAMVSHELRTPLNAIIGFANLMLTETYGPIAPARYREYVQDIAGSGEHLLKLINDILDMARLESGRLKLHPVRLSIAETVQAVIRLVRCNADKAELALLVEVDASLPDIDVDERAFRQILLNLLSNAIKFTPAGGQVTVRACRADPDKVVLDVVDTGVGIAAEDMDRVLQPFGQADSRLSRAHNGSGLGLSIVKGLVEAHGGVFHLNSTLGRGTRARIVLLAHAEDTVYNVKRSIVG